jgi:hypothetical protein
MDKFCKRSPFLQVVSSRNSLDQRHGRPAEKTLRQGTFPNKVFIACRYLESNFKTMAEIF